MTQDDFNKQIVEILERLMVHLVLNETSPTVTELDILKHMLPVDQNSELS